MKKQRIAAIEKEMTKVISNVLFGELKNPKIKGIVSVTHVRVTQDLKFVDVSFSVLPMAGQTVNREAVLKGLNETRGYFRKRIGEEIKIRFVPEVRVHLDDSIEHAVKISKLLNEVKE
ncbi:30S ribosome-binding factor RbfA [uncultured Ilyobacter sp.]|jgi:ribosome-binding factor A|uniref:30S ribosome-binding factor RbfA n=1 Tax=uncultured Ilyobacter sp. TaxID=544433 RepID=UPI0029C08B7A|nr:30S ribosome-binding factor RbfA [uncultured Ilyobacter sp.]